MIQEEYNQLESYLVKIAVDTLGITKEVAKLRIEALIKSNVLSNFGSPDSLEFHVAIDTAMQIPQLSIEK